MGASGTDPGNELGGPGLQWL